MSNENPLNLPKGSVRAIIALAITLLFCFVVLFGKAELDLQTIIVMVLSFYFISRDKNSK